MRILSIIKYDLVKVLRNRTVLFLIIILPLAMMFFVGIAYSNMVAFSENYKIPVGLVNYDKSEFVKAMVSNLEKNDSIKIVEMKEEELYQSVRNFEVEMGFIIPENFENRVLAGENPQIRLLKLPTSVDYAVVEGLWNEAFGNLRIYDITSTYVADKIRNISDDNKGIIIQSYIEKVETELKKTPIVSVKEIRVSGDSESSEYNGKNRSIIGIVVMFVMFSAVWGMGEMLEEKKNYTWNRLGTTPTSWAVVILGKIIATFITSWIQLAILMVFGRYIMGVDWGSSVISTFLVLSVYILCVTGLGMLLATLAKTNAQLGAYSSILIVATSMLSGCHWPIELVPEFMQKIAKFFPQYWALKGLSNTVSANMGLGSAIFPVIVLTLMGTLFFLLTVVNQKLRNQNKHYS